MDIISVKANGIVFEVLAQPGSRITRIDGLISNRLKIRLTAKAVDGAANMQLRQLLSECLKVSKSSVTLISGETSRHKSIFVQGDSEQLSALLIACIDESAKSM